MLDTRARRLLDPWFQALATGCLRRGLAPTQVTLLALLAGLGAAALVALHRPWPAVALLWLSGLLDALDGEMARRSGRVSAWGTLLDITGDRVVEGAVLLGLALRAPAARHLPLLVLAVTFILSLTVFLTTGALAQGQPGRKSFYYQAGLMERSEGFLAFTALILLPAHMAPLAYLAAGLVLVTVAQRLAEARQLLNR